MPTLRTFARRYRADYLLYHRSARSLEGLSHFERAFGEQPLNAIGPREVDAWRRERLRAGIRPATINRNVAVLGGLLRYAVELGVLPAHPLRGLKTLPILDEPRVRHLNEHEETRLRETLTRRDARLAAERALWNHWRRERGYPELPELPAEGYADYLTPAVLLAMNTGLRRGELLALRWADIDDGQLVVRAVSAKSRRWRHVPLNSESRVVLGRWRGQAPSGDLVFSHADGTPIRSIRKAWQSVLKEAVVHDFRWHDLRHHFASRLVMAGVPLNTVRELLGHADLKMTLRYAHLARGHLVEAVERLG